MTHAEMMQQLRATLAKGAAKVFDDAVDAKVQFAERLLALGIGSAAEARPYAIVWAGKKYDVAVHESQRQIPGSNGLCLTLDKDAPKFEAAKKMVTRVLQAIYGGENEGKKEASKTDVVERLIASFMKLAADDKARAIKGINAAMKAAAK